MIRIYFISTGIACDMLYTVLLLKCDLEIQTRCDCKKKKRQKKDDSYLHSSQSLEKRKRGSEYQMSKNGSEVVFISWMYFTICNVDFTINNSVTCKII